MAYFFLEPQTVASMAIKNIVWGVTMFTYCQIISYALIFKPRIHQSVPSQPHM